MTGRMAERLVRRLTAEDSEEIIRVFCASFHDYPVMRFVIGEDSPEFKQKLRLLIELFVMSRVYRGEPLLGVEADGEIHAAATLSFPDLNHTAPETDALRRKVWEELGEEANARYHLCGEVWGGLERAVPQVHLNMVGVVPSYQGRGLASALLKETHKISAERKSSTGVSLTTEDIRNVDIYSAAGYEIVGHANIGPSLSTWSMFRED